MYFNSHITIVDDIQLIPNHCDFIAFTLHSSENFKFIADMLLSKSKFVLIDLDELTFVDVFKHANALLDCYSNLKIVSQIKSNVSNKIDFSGHWFTSPINFYSYTSNSQWAMDSLNAVDTEFYRPYLFDCMLGRKKTDRDYIESLYHASPHKNKILFTYYKNNIKDGIWDFPVDNIQDSGQLIKHNNNMIVPCTVIPTSVYNQTYYSIVSETLVFNEYNFYTEKIAKPILAKRPFVVFSGQYYLKNLKSLGFKTFDCVINEEYDNVADYNTRAAMAWEQVEKLMALDPTDVYFRTEHVREYNYHLFRSNDWTKHTKKIISQILQTI
jgi:hypothetical protein